MVETVRVGRTRKLRHAMSEPTESGDGSSVEPATESGGATGRCSEAPGSADSDYEYDPPPLVPTGTYRCFSREALIESARRWMRHHAEDCSQEWHMARLGLLIDFVTDLYDGNIPPNK